MQVHQLLGVGRHFDGVVHHGIFLVGMNHAFASHKTYAVRGNLLGYHQCLAYILYGHLSDTQHIHAANGSDEGGGCPVAGSFIVLIVRIEDRGECYPVMISQLEADSFFAQGLDEQLVMKVVDKRNIGYPFVGELDDVAVLHTSQEGSVCSESTLFVLDAGTDIVGLEIDQCPFLAKQLGQVFVRCLDNVEKEYIGCEVQRISQSLHSSVLGSKVLSAGACL